MVFKVRFHLILGCGACTEHSSTYFDAMLVFNNRQKLCRHNLKLFSSIFFFVLFCFRYTIIHKITFSVAVATYWTLYYLCLKLNVKNCILCSIVESPIQDFFGGT